MFSKEDILARLQNGEDASAIAQEMADTLNAAVAESNEAAEAKAREIEETANRNERELGLVPIVESVIAYTKQFYPSLYNALKEDLKDEDCTTRDVAHDFVELLDAATEWIEKVSPAIDDLIDSIEASIGNVAKSKEQKDEIGDTLDKWLKSLG